jgi:hypothetical protein
MKATGAGVSNGGAAAVAGRVKRGREQTEKQRLTLQDRDHSFNDVPRAPKRAADEH